MVYSLAAKDCNSLSRVLPSIPSLFQSVERHFFDGQFGGFSPSGIYYNNLPHVQTLPTVAAEGVWCGMRTRKNADFREVFRWLSGCGL
jgi:hypothetical protein